MLDVSLSRTMLAKIYMSNNFSKKNGASLTDGGVRVGGARYAERRKTTVGTSHFKELRWRVVSWTEIDAWRLLHPSHKLNRLGNLL